MSGTQISIKCTKCEHTSSIPPSMANRDSFHTFCNNCMEVTNHTVIGGGGGGVGGGGSSAAKKARDDSLRSVDLPATPQANRFDYQQGGGAARQQQEQAAAAAAGAGRAVEAAASSGDQQQDDDGLWRSLLMKLEDNSIPIGEFMQCADTNRMLLFQALNFDRYDQQRLLQISHDRDPRKIIPPIAESDTASIAPSASTNLQVPSKTVSRTTSNQRGGGAAGSNSRFGLASNAPQGRAGGAAPAIAETSPFRGGNQYAGRSPSYGRRSTNNSNGAAPPTQSLIHGLTQHGDQLVARCTVFPDLPAEFWCCACNALVSSRCHVVGIHKDHPFITLRLAAESHVRDVASWAERCRTQLNITENVIGNLRHATDVIDHNMHQQYNNLDKFTDQMINDICAWRDQIKSDIAHQTDAEHRSIAQAVDQTQDMFELFGSQLQMCEPLLNNMPPADQSDRASEDWALRFLDFVSKLKLVNADPIAMPRILIPEVRCTFTPTTATEVLKQVNNPVGVRLPDIVDPGYFHFPQPTTSTRTPFVLNMPPDGRQKGVIIENNRTLTRTQDVAPSHLLVSGSQIFYSGVTSWEVHVDKMGHGMGRILAGIVIHGSDGEGVVWDGHRIVGPNEGETRTLSEKFKLKPGSILRFVLELDTPQSYLNCFFEREGVARIPLPAASSGWVPAFSVFGPQDQVTVVPTQGAGAMEGSIPKNSSLHPSLRADGGGSGDTVTSAKIQQQQLLIASLQQQLNAINQRMAAPPAPAAGQQSVPAASLLDTSGFSPSRAGGAASSVARGTRGGADTSFGGYGGGGASDPAAPFHRSVSQQSRGRGGVGASGELAAAAAVGPIGSNAESTALRKRPTALSYSPELEQLLNFANSI